MKPETDYTTTTIADVTKTLPIALDEHITANDTVSIDRQHQQCCDAQINQIKSKSCI